MIVSRHKKNSDIAGYVLYMWQIEDLLRASKLDMNTIRETIIKQYEQPEDVKKELEEWYENLVVMMQNEKKEESGHLQVITNTVNDMNRLHITLMHSKKEVGYQHQFMKAVPLIKELEEKMQPRPEHDIELMLAAMYNAFVLKLQGKEISEGTNEALKVFGKTLSMLSAKYREDQKGELNPE
ncbi:uncharacterized protein DUF4924 [Marinilabilia salmonicolor]|uniref:DUF4924 family protein n=1 Tax=Marinilabilia salmonicolor TaxID=989 RepID=UPI000D06F267|nr:DUF4924 family protein [Marinilabilia salmonicolor]PRZ00582.1 uncharacterized protein DUF4924 [Marinilabilia salmonicolor]